MLVAHIVDSASNRRFGDVGLKSSTPDPWKKGNAEQMAEGGVKGSFVPFMREGTSPRGAKVAYQSDLGVLGKRCDWAGTWSAPNDRVSLSDGVGVLSL